MPFEGAAVAAPALAAWETDAQVRAEDMCDAAGSSVVAPAAGQGPHLALHATLVLGMLLCLYRLRQKRCACCVLQWQDAW